MSTPADTFTDRTGATDEEFRARVAVFDAAEEPEEVTVIRAMLDLADELKDRSVKAVVEGHYWPSDAPRRHVCVGKASAYAVAADEIRAALAALRGDRAPLAGQPTTDEETDRG